MGKSGTHCAFKEAVLVHRAKLWGYVKFECQNCKKVKIVVNKLKFK